MAVNEIKSILTTGFVGVASTSIAVGVSFAAQAEMWLRLTSLLIGIAVGLATLVTLLNKLKGK
jgi:xanthine/uracil permease